MRKVQLLFICLMLSVAAFAADKVVKLPKPNLNRTGTVMKALSERQSTREYASKALTLADLSDLLWAANGINRSDAGKRTAPSALNKQDVDVYVILPEGSYLYDAKNHQLNLIAEGDYRGAVAGGQAFVKTAPLHPDRHRHLPCVRRRHRRSGQSSGHHRERKSQPPQRVQRRGGVPCALCHCRGVSSPSGPAPWPGPRGKGPTPGGAAAG